MAATLANGGVNPRTGERALKAENVARVLSVMATCGMYDWSGEWMYRIGLPAKSGVGGGIIAVLPGQMGLGTFSPRLDEFGNSIRGVKACEAVADTLNLHLLDATATAVAGRDPHLHRGPGLLEARARPCRRRAAGRLRRRRSPCCSCRATCSSPPPRSWCARSSSSAPTPWWSCSTPAASVGPPPAPWPCCTRCATTTGWPPRWCWPVPPRPCSTPWPPTAVRGPTSTCCPTSTWPSSSARTSCWPMPAGASTVRRRRLGLDGIDLLAVLDADDRTVLGELLVTETYAAGELILREGEPADRLCLLVSGQRHGAHRPRSTTSTGSTAPGGCAASAPAPCSVRPPCSRAACARPTWWPTTTASCGRSPIDALDELETRAPRGARPPARRPRPEPLGAAAPGGRGDPASLDA